MLKFLDFNADYLVDVMEIEKLSFPDPWSREMFEREISLPISHFFVAEFEFKIVGYTGYWLISGEAHLINIAVHPDYRNRGFGREILENLIKYAVDQGIKKILLEVRESNVSAQHLYESSGFKAVGFRPNYYKNEGAVLMDRINNCQ